eukprot:m.252944 g.252944  ORF g.252944 m.252944 type:complete len:263 (+) comp15925_c0_seq3:153-941(+)
MQVDMQALGAADAAPDAFVDPISKEVMRDPVSTVDGQTYEREHIAEWLKNHDTSPLTNARLGDKTLTPNIALRKAIDEWAAAHFKTIPRSQLKIGRQIARSSFKTVWQGEVILGAAKKEVAVLEVRDGDIAAEVKTLIRLGRHPHLVRYIGVCHDVSEGKQYILVEYAPLGSLAVAMEQIEDGIKPGHQRELTWGWDWSGSGSGCSRSQTLEGPVGSVFDFPLHGAVLTRTLQSFTSRANSVHATANLRGDGSARSGGDGPP